VETGSALGGANQPEPERGWEYLLAALGLAQLVAAVRGDASLAFAAQLASTLIQIVLLSV